MKRSFALITAILFLLGFGTGVALAAGPDAVGAVYTMSNAVGGNEILVFDRATNGMLSPAGAVATGGEGTGGGLGNQSGLLLNDDGRYLLAVNAGSHDVSVLAVRPDGLELVETEASGGQRPVSVTAHGDLVYVLNAGGTEGGMDNITGFTLGHDGDLEMLPGSTVGLSAASTGPAQVGFTPDGRVLVVTEKGTNLIDTYTVDGDGFATGPATHASSGMTPFGFGFGKRGQLIVSEAFGGAADASTASSYEVGRDGSLTLLDPSEPTTETAACWVGVTRSGRFAYTTNTGSGTVTGFSVGFDGDLTLLDDDGATGMTGMGSRPIDLDFDRSGRFLYTLNSGNQTISGFRVHGDGGLSPVPGAGGLPEGANGLAAR